MDGLELLDGRKSKFVADEFVHILYITFSMCVCVCVFGYACANVQRADITMIQKIYSKAYWLPVQCNTFQVFHCNKYMLKWDIRPHSSYTMISYSHF